MGSSLNYLEIANEVTQLTGARQILSGGTLLYLLALSLALITEFHKFNTDKTDAIEVVGHIVTVAFFGIMLASYSFLYELIVSTFESIGTVKGAGATAEKLFSRRWNTLANLLTESEQSSFLGVGFSSVGYAFQKIVCVFALQFSMAVAYILTTLQTFMLATLYNMAPIIIGFAALHTSTRSFLASWILSLMEISMWGVCMNVLVTVCYKLAPSGPDLEGIFESSLADELILAVVYGISLTMIPVFAAMIVRQQPGAAAGQRALQGAKMIASLNAMAATAALNVGDKAWGALKQGYKTEPQSNSSPGSNATATAGSSVGAHITNQTAQAPGSAGQPDRAAALRRHHQIKDNQKKNARSDSS